MLNDILIDTVVCDVTVWDVDTSSSRCRPQTCDIVFITSPSRRPFSSPPPTLLSLLLLYHNEYSARRLTQAWRRASQKATRKAMTSNHRRTTHYVCIDQFEAPCQQTISPLPGSRGSVR